MKYRLPALTRTVLCLTWSETATLPSVTDTSVLERTRLLRPQVSWIVHAVPRTVAAP